MLFALKKNDNVNSTLLWLLLLLLKWSQIWNGRTIINPPGIKKTYRLGLKGTQLSFLVKEMENLLRNPQ